VRRSLLPLLLVSAAACAPRSAAPPGAPKAEAGGLRQVVVAGTTDTHGWVEGRMTPPPSGVAPARSGGLDVVAAYVGRLRAQHPGRVALVDAGDLFQGTMVSNFAEGQPVLDAYNEIGYTAAAIGNHEFDYGPLGEAVVARSPADDALGALKRNITAARFPFLGANIVEKATGRRPDWAKPHVMVDLDGVKLGIIGIADPATPFTTVPQNVASLAFTDPAPAIEAAARELRGAGADAVVVTAHMGSVCKDTADPQDTSSCGDDDDAHDVVRALPPGTIDAFFAGHTHRHSVFVVNGVPVLQPLPFTQGLAVVDLWVDPATHRVVRSTYRAHVEVCEKVYEGTSSCDPRRAKAGAAVVPATFEGAPVVPEGRVQAVLRPWLEKVEVKRSAKIGVRVAAPFTRNYDRPSALGALAADALLAAVPEADLAITNSGGLRSDLRAPEPTYGDVYEIIPFDNMIATMKVSGAQLLDVLGQNGANGHGSHQVAGIRVEFDYAQPPGAARVSSLKLANGRDVTPDGTYTLATNDYLAAGGSGFARLVKTMRPEDVHVRGDLPLLRDALVQHLQRLGAKGPLAPRDDGRLVIHGLSTDAQPEN
jgi:5'-nucleotidase